MIGSFITRGLVLIFGYAYPAYECYKSVEMNRPDIEQLRFWCQYWILVAGLTVCERIGDAFIGWVPMYGEAKLAFFIYLWFPKTKGTKYVYDSFFRPYVAKHETEIDRNLLELRTRVGDMALLYWQKASSYAQTRVFDILQYIASQSTPNRPAQSTQKSAAPSNRKSAADGEPPSATSGTSSSEHEEADRPPAASLNELKNTPTQALVGTSNKASSSSEEQVMQIDSVPPPATTETAQPPPQDPPQDMVMEEAGLLTRARSRKTRITASNR